MKIQNSWLLEETKQRIGLPLLIKFTLINNFIIMWGAVQEWRSFLLERYMVYLSPQKLWGACRFGDAAAPQPPASFSCLNRYGVLNKWIKPNLGCRQEFRFGDASSPHQLPVSFIFFSVKQVCMECRIKTNSDVECGGTAPHEKRYPYPACLSPKNEVQTTAGGRCEKDMKMKYTTKVSSFFHFLYCTLLFGIPNKGLAWVQQRLVPLSIAKKTRPQKHPCL